nr:transposase [Nitrosospira lacus]
MMGVIETNIYAQNEYYAPRMQRWSVVQQELIPKLRLEVGPLMPRLEKVIHRLDGSDQRIYQIGLVWCSRPPYDQGALASAFAAKAVLGLTTTEAFTERLKVGRVLRRICGFSIWKRMPALTTFSRAFDEFAQALVTHEWVTHCYDLMDAGLLQRGDSEPSRNLGICRH